MSMDPDVLLAFSSPSMQKGRMTMNAFAELTSRLLPEHCKSSVVVVRNRVIWGKGIACGLALAGALAFGIISPVCADDLAGKSDRILARAGTTGAASVIVRLNGDFTAKRE